MYRRKNMTEIICAVYKIINTITGDFYIGSSKNVKHRWAVHKCPSTWKNNPNNPMYLDMNKYGVDKFDFQVVEVVEPEELKVTEQQLIEKVHPTYNNRNANGWDFDKYKEYQKSDKYNKYKKEYNNKYNNQLCSYNGETITLATLAKRFQRAGVTHSAKEAKKYLVL